MPIIYDPFPPLVKEAYGAKYKLFMSPHIYKVVNSMVHAVTSTRPKLRYVVGWDNKFFWRPLSLLPSGIQDLMIPPVPAARGINPDNN